MSIHSNDINVVNQSIEAARFMRTLGMWWPSLASELHIL